MSSRLSEDEWEQVLDEALRFYDAGEGGLRPDTYAPDLRATVESILDVRLQPIWALAEDWLNATGETGRPWAFLRYRGRELRRALRAATRVQRPIVHRDCTWAPTSGRECSCVAWAGHAWDPANPCPCGSPSTCPATPQSYRDQETQ